MDVLANPIWHALTTSQAHFARTRAGGSAACFPGEVTALAGLREPTADAIEELAGLLEVGERTGLFLERPLEDTAGIGLAVEVVEEAAMLQLVYDGGAPTPAVSNQDDLVELGPADHEAMRALAAIAQPGPFGRRTPELGTFIGLRVDGALVAMAGQRLRLPGWVEVSGVCTHPAHAGRGHARRLTRAQVSRIAGMGATPFLEVKTANDRALRIYEQLGFRVTRELLYVIVERPAPVR